MTFYIGIGVLVAIIGLAVWPWSHEEPPPGSSMGE